MIIIIYIQYFEDGTIHKVQEKNIFQKNKKEIFYARKTFIFDTFLFCPLSFIHFEIKFFVYQTL